MSIVNVEYAPTDWKARAEAAEARITQLEAFVKSAESIFQNCEVSSGCCCCGSDMENHGYYDNHAPVDQGEYAVSNWLKEVRKILNG